MWGSASSYVTCCLAHDECPIRIATGRAPLPHTTSTFFLNLLYSLSFTSINRLCFPTAEHLYPSLYLELKPAHPTHTHTHTHTPTHTHLQSHTHTDSNTHTYPHSNTYALTYSHTHTHMHSRTLTHSHTPLHTPLCKAGFSLSQRGPA